MIGRKEACETVRDRSLDYLAGALLRADAHALEEHLSSCRDCAEVLEEMRRGWELVGRLPDAEPPPGLKASTFAAVAEERGRQKRPGRAVLSVALGLATAVAASLSLHVRSNLPAMPLWVAISCGATWASLFAAFYYAALSREGARQVGGFRLSHLSICGLAAMGLYLLGSAVLPLPNLARSADWSTSVGEPALLFLAGALYALVPMLFCASFLCARSRCSRMAYLVLPSAMFLALLAPGILVECVRFSIGAVVGLSIGSMAGALLGNLAGVWLGAAVALHLAQQNNTTQSGS